MTTFRNQCQAARREKLTLCFCKRRFLTHKIPMCINGRNNRLQAASLIISQPWSNKVAKCVYWNVMKNINFRSESPLTIIFIIPHQSTGRVLAGWYLDVPAALYSSYSVWQSISDSGRPRNYRCTPYAFTYDISIESWAQVLIIAYTKKIDGWSWASVKYSSILYIPRDIVTRTKTSSEDDKVNMGIWTALSDVNVHDLDSRCGAHTWGFRS